MPSVNSMRNWSFTLLITVMIVACNSSAKQPVQQGPHAEIPEEGTNIQAYLSEAGLQMGQLESRVKGKLHSPFMYHYQRADSSFFEFPRTLHVDFYRDSVLINEKPTIESQLDSRYGKYLPNQEKVFLRDSVVIKNILKGDTAYCKTLWWDQRTQRFSTTDSVEIHEPDKILHGTDMEADQNFRWHQIGHMTGTIRTAGNNLPK